MMSKECLKLNICPICKKSCSMSPKLLALPVYECLDCNVEWNEYGIDGVNSDGKRYAINRDGDLKVID